MTEVLLGKKKSVSLYGIVGDITQIPVVAIMTTINSGGLWYGGVDGAIQRAAGDYYHDQARSRMPLNDLEVVVARGNGISHRGKFKDVVFVVDDLISPLNDVVFKGLEVAHRENYGKILIPTIRMGVMAGVVEKTPQEAVERIESGVEKFIEEYGDKTQLKNLTWVVYNDERTIALLKSGFKSW